MIPINPDVPAQTWEPLIALSISTAPVAFSTAQPANLFLVAPALLSGAAMTASPYSLTAGTASPNEIAQQTNVTRANQAYGRRSPLANRFRAAIQAQPIGLNIFCGAVPEPSGSGFTGVATRLLTAIGTAVGSGEIKVFLGGHLTRTPVASGDTATVFAGNLKSAIDSQIPDAPVVSASLISATVPLAYTARGETGNSLPIVVYIPPDITGLLLSPGKITATTNAAGASAAASIWTITCGTMSLSLSVAIGTTPTQWATAAAALINANAFPLTATSALGVLTLYYRNGWVVQRIQCASTEDALGQTYALQDRHDSSGGLASVTTTAGSATATALAGSGTPTLTTLLANRARTGTMTEWACDFLDSTSTGAIHTHVETYGNGLNQENQRVTFASDEVIDTSQAGVQSARGRVSGLTDSWRYAMLVCQDPYMQAANLAVATAADLCAASLPFNFDGHPLKGGSLQPFYPPRADVDLDLPTRDAAMRNWYVTPVIARNGVCAIVRGVTTWSAADNRNWSDLSYGRMFDDARYRLRSFLLSRFTGKVYFSDTTPRVANAFTRRDVQEACKEWLESRDGITIDGAKNLARQVQVDVSEAGDTILIAMGLKVPREAHKMTGVLAQAAY